MTSEQPPFVTWGPFRSGPIAPVGGSRIPRADDSDRVAASFELMAAVLSGSTLTESLTLVAGLARGIAKAERAFIALPGIQPGMMSIQLAVGADADQVLGLSFRTSRSMIGRTFTLRRALASQVPERTTAEGLPTGPILLLPLDTGEATRGVLAVSGRPANLPFSPSVNRQLVLFATTSAIMIELAQERGADSAALREISQLPATDPT
jgi:GAF domain